LKNILLILILIGEIFKMNGMKNIGKNLNMNIILIILREFYNYFRKVNDKTGKLSIENKSYILPNDSEAEKTEVWNKL